MSPPGPTAQGLSADTATTAAEVLPSGLAGSLLADRYRLIEELPGPPDTVLWRAVDEILARPVAVKILAGRDPDAAGRFLDAAARTGSVRSPLLAELYDAAQTGAQTAAPTGAPTDQIAAPADALPSERTGTEGDGGLTYVVTEWLPGRPLHRLLEDGPLLVDQVVELTRGTADALTAAHESGVIHGRVHLGNVFVGADGRLRLTDAALATAAHGDPVPAGAEGVAADTRDLAAVSYALLTGRWPGGPSPQPSGTLALAPRSGGLVCTPRQLRAAVPRPVDRAVLAALDPRRAGRQPLLITPDALAQALERAVAGRPERRSRRTGQPTARLRRRLPALALAGALGALGTGSYLLGLAVGDLPDNGRDLDALVSVGVGPAAGAPRARPLVPIGVTDVDPAGDGEEQSSSVVNITHSDTSSPWLTDTYRTARFGGLKDGVGLQVDLGRRREVGSIDVAFSRPGTVVQLRAGDSPGDPRPHPVVASGRSGSGVLRLLPRAGAGGRYWSLWITQLPQDGPSGGYRAGIAELRLFPR